MTTDFLEGDIRGVIDHHLAEGSLEWVGGEMERAAMILENIAEELREEEYEHRTGIPYKHLDPDDAHGRFGGAVHYRLIQMALHRIVNRYYEKNARITVENEELSFTSSLGGAMAYRGGSHSEKKLHPDIFVQMEPGESGMDTQKTIIVECETGSRNLLQNDLRMAAYNLLRKDNQDRNELMIYIAVPESLRGEVDKPEWANDLWYFDVEKED